MIQQPYTFAMTLLATALFAGILIIERRRRRAWESAIAERWDLLQALIVARYSLTWHRGEAWTIHDQDGRQLANAAQGIEAIRTALNMPGPKGDAPPCR